MRFSSDEAQDELSEGGREKTKYFSCTLRFIGEIYDDCRECFSLDTEEVADEKDDGYWG